MKKIAFLILITINVLGQSVTISPNNTQSLLHIKKGASGVGVFNPNANLHIESNVNNYINLLTPNTLESGILFGNPTSTADGGIIYNAGNTKGMQFRTNNNVTRLTIDAMGNMGIGATNPASKLDIQGSLYRSHFYYDTSEDTYLRGGKGASRVIINDIVGMGNVGIGTNNPQSKLHISQGNLRVDALAGVGTRALGADASGNIVALPTQSTNTVAFAATRLENVPFLIQNNFNQMISLTNEEYDIGNNYDLGVFTAPSAGVYYFVINLSWDPNSNGIRQLDLRKNNISLKTDLISSNSNGLILPQKYTTSMYLNTNDQVTLWLYQTSGSALNVWSGLIRDPIIFSGYKVN